MATEPEIIEGETIDQPASSAIAVTQPAALGTTLSLKELKSAVKDEAAKRGVIIEFVKSQLVEGTDYGKIHVAKGCQNPYGCKINGHFSKNNLLKPGQEKIFSLFNITSHLERDAETLDMLGNPGNVVAFVCKVYRGNILVAEGRGACGLAEKNNINTAIKIAEKRARMDACLSLGFSEFFTQDLEDEQADKPVPPPAAQPAPEPPAAPPPKLPADNAPALASQRARIFKVLNSKNITDADDQKKVLNKFLVYSTAELKYGQAEKLINELEALSNHKIMDLAHA